MRLKWCHTHLSVRWLIYTYIPPKFLITWKKRHFLLAVQYNQLLKREIESMLNAVSVFNKVTPEHIAEEQRKDHIPTEVCLCVIAREKLKSSAITKIKSEAVHKYLLGFDRLTFKQEVLHWLHISYDVEYHQMILPLYTKYRCFKYGMMAKFIMVWKGQLPCAGSISIGAQGHSRIHEKLSMLSSNKGSLCASQNKTRFYYCQWTIWPFMCEFYKKLTLREMERKCTCPAWHLSQI